MRVVVAGKNQIAVDVLAAVISKYPTAEVVALPNRGDDGRTGWQPSFARFARARGIGLVTLDEAYASADVFLSVEFDRIVRPDRFRTERVYNIHFSLLPKYRGVFTAIWPVLLGDTEAGVTLHYIHSGIDTGDIIAQRRFPLRASTTSRDVYLMDLEVGTALVIESLAALVSGEPPRAVQQWDGATYNSKTSIDWPRLAVPRHATAHQVSSHIRAFAFREYQLPRIAGLPAEMAEVLPRKSTGKPGDLVSQSLEYVEIGTLDQDVRVTVSLGESLAEAVRDGDRARMRLLLDAGVDVNDRNGRGWAPLHIACFHGRVELVDELLRRYRANLDARNFRGTTALMYARSCADRVAARATTETLLAAGASLEARDEDGRTVVDCARTDGTADFLDWVGQGSPAKGAPGTHHS